MYEFTILLNTKAERTPIDPPSSFYLLGELVKDKFTSNIEENVITIHYFHENEKITLKDDNDYLKFLDFADTLENKEINIYVGGDEGTDSEEDVGENDENDDFETISKNKKSKINANSNYKESNNKTDDYCINGKILK